MSKKGKKTAPAASTASSRGVQGIAMLDWVSDDFKASATFLEKQVNAVVTYMPGMETMPGVNFGVEIGAMVRPWNEKDGDQRTVLYVNADSVKDETKRLEGLKAKVIDTDTVPDMGIWAILNVPGGLRVGLWESFDPNGPKPPVTKSPHDEDTVSFVEITSSDPQATADFLGAAFGWKFEAWKESPAGPYWYCPGDQKSFSIGLRPFHEQVDTSEVIAFLNVKSVDAALKKVTGKNKAKKLSGKEQMGPHGWLAYIEMPGNIKAGLWENAPKAEAKEEKEPEVAAAAPKKRAAAKPKAKGKAAAAAPPSGGRKRAASKSGDAAPAAKKSKK